MKIIYISLFSLCLSTISAVISSNAGSISARSYDQARQIAIQDFSKTRLYKKDSVFLISVGDTFHRMTLKRINEHEADWVLGNIYPELITVDIGPYSPNKFFLDTTVDISAQTRFIPSRWIEQNGKLFFWYDKHYTLTNNTIKILDKYQLLRRGGPNDLERYSFVIDDAAQGAQYYFCRSNLNVYKRVITSVGLGYYDPPNIRCNP